MQLMNLKVERIIIHQVFQRGEDGKRIQPSQSHDYTRFDRNAMDAFLARVKDALGEGSKAVQMEIVNQDTNDLPVLIEKMSGQSEEDFATSSFDIAIKLANCQQRRNIPGGIVVVFIGTQGHQSQKFIGIIKAEIHSAYEKLIDKKSGEISLKFVEEALLTPGNKLYKTAGFFQKRGAPKKAADLNEKWAVMVSDYQISNVDGKAAAKYFYADFLGCGYPKTSARTTKEFYEATSDFIAGLDIPVENKNDLYNALTTYLKVDTSTVISAADFSSKYMDLDMQDEFGSFMEGKGMPTTAFTKDIEHIASKLKYRKVSFRSNVRITGPSETFKDLVIIETIEGDPDESGTPAEWTKIIVKDRISQQE